MPQRCGPAMKERCGEQAEGDEQGDLDRGFEQQVHRDLVATN